MKKITPRRIIFKLFKMYNKETALKAAKEKKRNKNKDNSMFLVRNSANKKTVQQHL